MKKTAVLAREGLSFQMVPVGGRPLEFVIQVVLV